MWQTDVLNCRTDVLNKRMAHDLLTPEWILVLHGRRQRRQSIIFMHHHSAQRNPPPSWASWSHPRHPSSYSRMHPKIIPGCVLDITVYKLLLDLEHPHSSCNGQFLWSPSGTLFLGHFGALWGLWSVIQNLENWRHALDNCKTLWTENFKHYYGAPGTTLKKNALNTYAYT